MTPLEAMKQALEALEARCGTNADERKELIPNLSTAIEELEKVMLRRRDFEKHGDAGGWLISEAFDLNSGRSLEYENLIKKAAALLDKDEPGASEIAKMNEALVAALSPKDVFLFNWRYICKQKGWLK